MQHEVLATNQLTTTINNIGQLNFADWQKIAVACDNTNVWAFFRWIETADKEQLQAVSRQEIKLISEEVGYGSGFVADKIDEHC
jgi:hypothetical protein